MSPREVVMEALRAAIGGPVTDATILGEHLDPRQRLAVVEEVERRAGLMPAELGDAYLERTAGDLVAAVATYLGRRR